MKRILTLIMIAFFGLSFNASSQGLPIDLGQINADIEISSGAETVAKDRAKGITKQAASTLPVVVHIIHKGTPINTNLRYVEQPLSENISDLQVKSAIDNLNDRFANTWTPYWETPGVTNPGLYGVAKSVNALINFAFAQRTPDGNPTNGINRYNIYEIPGLSQSEKDSYAENGIRVGNAAVGLDLNVLKEALAWNTNRYINIYVVSEVGGNNGGCGVMYDATFPNSDLIGEYQDGIAIQYNKFGYGAYSTLTEGLNLQLVEAMGTYLGLYPVYQGMENCQDVLDEIAAEELDPDYCLNNGDRVCDTGPTMYVCSSLCLDDKFCDGTLEMPDGWLSTYDNYMNTGGGSFCKVRFTQGQIDRMESTITNLRTGLTASDNYALTQPNEDGLAVELSVRRTCANDYEPTIFVTNVGFADVLAGDYQVTLKLGNKTILTIPGTDIGVLPIDATVQIPFPTLLIDEVGEYTVLAEAVFTAASQRVDGELTDNTSTHVINKVNDGYVNFNMQYRNRDGGAGIVIKKINADGSEIVVMDGTKYFNNMVYQHNKNWIADNSQFAGYFKYGGAEAEELGIAGEIAPFGTIWLTDIDAENNKYYQVSSTYYIEPGEYAVELNAKIFYLNEERWYSIFGNCSDGQNGENCYITINELGSVINSATQLYNETSDATFAQLLVQGNDYPFAFDPLDVNNPDGGSIEDDGTPNPGIVGAETKRFTFTVLENSSTDAFCCLDVDADGVCDGYSLDNSDAAIFLKNRYPSPTSVVLELEMTKPGLGVIEDVTFQIATDQEFNNLVIDYDTTFSNINQEYFLTRRGQNIFAKNLTPETTYYARAIVNDRGKNVYSNPIQFDTPVDACANYGNGSTLTYDGLDYDLISIYNMCWMKQALQTKQTVGGTSLTDGSSPLYWAQSVQAGNPTFAIDPSRSEQALFDAGHGFWYNREAKLLDDICPTGFHVTTHNDWMTLDTILGPGRSIRRISSVSQGGYNELGINFRPHGWFQPSWDRSLAPGDITAQDVQPLSGSTFWPSASNSSGNASVTSQGKFWVLNDEYYTGADGEGPRAGWSEILRVFSGHAYPARYSKSVEAASHDDSLVPSSVDYGAWHKQQGFSIRCVAGGYPDPVELSGKCGNIYALDEAYDGPGTRYRPSCNFNPQATGNNFDLCELRDECGVCGGIGINEGACDCNGNVRDALGICGGPCSADENADGICDDIASFVNGSPEACDYEVAKYFNGVNYSIAGWGGECWFLDNLRNSYYSATGEAIQTANTKDLWVTAANNKLAVMDTRANHEDLTPNEKAVYGYMYNWYAQNDERNICPAGWHPATDRDWRSLELSIGVEADIVNRSISARGENTNAGFILRGGAIEFNAYPGGIRTQDGNLRGVGLQSWMWSSSPWNTIRGQYKDNAYHRSIGQEGISNGISRYSHSFGTSGSKGHGMSVRCVKNSPTSPGN